jgi:hypothetical protein
MVVVHASPLLLLPNPALLTYKINKLGRYKRKFRMSENVPMPPCHYYWWTDGFRSPIGDQNKKIKKRGGPNSSVRLAYFQANRLLTELYKQETEIR